MSVAAAIQTPQIDWYGALPLLLLLGGGVVTLLLGLARSAATRTVVVPGLSALSFAAAAVLAVLQWGDGRELFVASGSQGALRFDDLGLAVVVIVSGSGLATVLLSLRARAPVEVQHGEYYALVLFAASGMVVLAAAQNLVSVFLGFELLSIPLYVLCATEMRRAASLESGLKYLIIGSVGSATLLYGLALLYGATGNTDLRGVGAGVAAAPGDPMVLAGIALTLAGLAFKAAIAPFHQWAPDVYEGAPTPITTFMAVATKAAAFGALLRLFGTALIDAHDTWGPMVAALSAISIVVGNVGALGQYAMKRLLAWSSIAQAGYLLAGVTVGSKLGAQALVFYLAGYAVMTTAAFAVVVARERETALGDAIEALRGIGTERPLLGWVMTIAMFGLAGIPASVGFIGKFSLIAASADGGYTWLGVLIVIGSLLSLGYYLRVVSVLWSRPGDEPLPAGAAQPRLAGAEPAGERAGIEVTVVAVAAAAATILFGVLPGWLMDVARDAGRALGLL